MEQLIDLLREAFDGIQVGLSFVRATFLDRLLLADAEPTLQLLKHVDHHQLVVTGLSSRLVANETKAGVDDGHEHVHADEDHDDHEESEAERTEKGRGALQLLDVELHQHHFEEHLGGVQERGTAGDAVEKEQVEETEEGHEDHGEHHREEKQGFRGMLNGVREERETTVETTETKELQGGEEATVAEKVEQDIADVGGEL